MPRPGTVVKSLTKDRIEQALAESLEKIEGLKKIKELVCSILRHCLLMLVKCPE
jgi:hypothetical protein